MREGKGPGTVNFTAPTSQTPQLDEERRPEGFHLYSEKITRRGADHLPRGLGRRRDLINGFSMEVERRAKVHPRRRWSSGRCEGDRNWRMEELTASSPPGEDDG